MPEGDTVWRAGQHLHRALAGKVLQRSEFRVPRWATVDLRGRSVLAVVARGKHLLTRVEGGVSIHTHFRLDGSFRLYRPGQPWSGGPSHEVRLVLANQVWTAVGYRLPVLALLATDAEHTVVGHLGPDLLGPDWDLERATANLRAAPQVPVGLALLDQRNLAGLGNLYRVEALYLRGHSPWTPVGAISDLPALLDLCRRLLAANLRHPEQSTTGRRHGTDAHHVFGRQGLACRRCGQPIRRASQGQPPDARATYWCPGCQPGHAPAGSSYRAPRAGRTSR